MKEGINQGLRTWIEIDKSAIRHNYEVFRGLISSDVKFCAVVKSNAYGCDFIQFSKKMTELGVDWFAVDSITEGMRLRKEGIDKPILILGYTLPEKIIEAINNDISISVSSFESLDVVTKISKNENKKAKVHIKVDTGMGRQGFLEGDMDKLINTLKSRKDDLEIEGLFTHFASAKDPTSSDGTSEQINEFLKWKKLFKNSGLNVIFHAAASSGALLYPESHFDMVRIGISMYGLWPSLEAKGYMQGKIELKPLLSWKAVVSEVKKLPKGSKIGYDFTEELKRDSTIAICPIGYWHGFSRKLSGIGSVLIKGKRAKVLGRVSMDIIAVDVTDISEVSSNEEVILIGRRGGEEIDAYEMANLDETSWYETVTRINPLIKRLYI